MKLLSVSLVLLFAAFCESLSHGATTVSLIALLANPQKYDGMEIRTEGYFDFYHHAELYIYPYSEDAKYLSFTNCFEIRRGAHDGELLSDAACQSKSHHHVILQGYFSAEDRGDMGAFAGSFHDIAELRVKEPKF